MKIKLMGLIFKVVVFKRKYLLPGAMVPQNCVTKTDHFGGSYCIYILVFLTPSFSYVVFKKKVSTFLEIVLLVH